VAAIQSNGTGGGNWSDPASWAGGVVPGEGDTVQIVSGDTITIDTDITVGDDTATPALDILNGGTLDWDNAGDDTLILKGDLYIRNGGTLDLDGTSDGTKTLTIKLNYSASLADIKYGIKSENGAIIVLQGFDKTRSYDSVSVSASGDTISTTNDNSSCWNVGDEIFVSGAYNQTERKTIVGFSGNQITVDSNFSYSHDATRYVGNLTRNIRFIAYDTSYETFIKFDTRSVQATITWVEFKDIATNPSVSSHGVTLEGGGTVSYCSAYTTNGVSGGFYLKNQPSTLTYNVGYNFGNLLAGGSAGAFLLVYVATGSNISNNFGARFALAAGIENRRANNSSFNNNIIHDSRYYGFFGWDSAANCTLDSNEFRDFNHGTYSPLCFAGCFSFTVSNTTIDSAEHAIRIYFSNANIVIDNLTATNLGTGAITFSSGYNDAYIHDSSFDSATMTNISNLLSGSRVRFGNTTLGGTTYAHKTYADYGSYEKQSTVKYSGDYALLMSPNDADNELVAEATVFAKAGETVAYSCYMRKDVSMAALPYVRLSGAGITTDTAAMTDSVDTWELLTVSGIAGENGFCKIEFVCQNASGSVYVDDDQDSFAHWFEGDIPSVVPKPSMTANDIMNTVVSSVSWSPGTFGALIKNINQFIQILVGWIIGR